MFRRVSAFAGFPLSRGITSRGQFNPIHDFSESLAEERRARNPEEFTRLITNPGPMRVGYSPDYLDWLYRGYQSKLRHYDARRRAGEGGEGEGEGEGGRVLRPPHSRRRLVGAAKRGEAQRALEAAAKAQGLVDLLERQPQFPAIHLDRARRFHLVELAKGVVLDRAFDAAEVWDKALLYRAILGERRRGYPDSFDYIFDAVARTVLGRREEERPPGGASPPRTPSEEDYLYFVYLVRRYYVENAVEGHVVLRCCREPNAAELLFSNPPPKPDKEVRASLEGGGGGSGSGDFAIRAPRRYPPIECLWRCEENLPLLTILVFGELNLMVSENPFVKFPNAHAFLTRPYAEEAAMQSGSGRGGPPAASAKPRGGPRWDRDGDVLSLASLIAERRRHLNLAGVGYGLSTALDGRAGDLRRLQQRHHREDLVGFQRLLRGEGGGGPPDGYVSFSDWSYLNPRAVRAEVRDRLQRRGLEALRLYDAAAADLFRVGFDAAEMAGLERAVEGVHGLPAHLPTLPHFIALITQDAHVGCLLYVVLPSDGEGEKGEKRRELERLVHQLAGTLHRIALEFHEEDLRRVNRQKVNVAATLLDDFVRAELKRCLGRPPADGNEGEEEEEEEGVKRIVRRLGDFRPFEGRLLDESGFTTDARVDDYARWMAPPATV